MMNYCSIAECENPRKARGWCAMHYDRWRNNGDPRVITKRHHLNPEDAFDYYTIPEPTTGCLLWWGTTTRDGYGVLRINGKIHRAHRYSWQRDNGPIPRGMVVDHVCHTPACVNVDHLRVATVSQNAQHRRGSRSDRTNNYARGVYKVGSGRYAARLKLKGKNVWLGLHATPEEAAQAAEQGRERFFGEYAGGSR